MRKHHDQQTYTGNACSTWSLEFGRLQKFCAADAEKTALACQALANLMAYGSGACASCSATRSPQSLRGHLNHAASRLQVCAWLLAFCMFRDHCLTGMTHDKGML